jgi:glycosyltransferase involved in cell wall biosynthesis
LKTIYYLHQYFRQPEEGGPIRSYHLAKGLVKRGFAVKMITCWNNPYKATQWIDGIEVVYLPIPYDNSFSFYKRLKAFVYYIFAAYKEVDGTTKNNDMVYATSTPLTVGVLALWIKCFKGLPYVFEVRDLWPKAAIDLGFLKNPILKLLASFTEYLIYKYSTAVVALSSPMAEGVYAKLQSTKKVSIVPNFSDNSFFKPQYSWPEKCGFSNGKVIISYIGTISTSKDPNAIFNLIYAAANFPKIFFYIAGDGGEMQTLKHRLNSARLQNFEFLPYLNKSEVRELLAKSHFALTSFVSIEVIEGSSPNKLFDALAMGTPVIINFGGWIKALVDDYSLGISYTKGEETAALMALLDLAQKPEQYAALSANCRAIAESMFDKEAAIDSIVAILAK